MKENNNTADQTKKNSMKLTISNEFTGFRKVTKSQNPATIRRIIRSSKASDCQSSTRIFDEAGTEYIVDDIGRGYELIAR